MNATFVIELSNLRFFAGHGMYQEEEITGNEFELNVIMKCEAPEAIITSIGQTINYADAFELIKEQFSKRRPLLETCAMEIAEMLHQAFPSMFEISISIKKLNPPITNFMGAVGLTFVKSFK